MKYILALFCLTAYVCSSFINHPIYLSTTEIDYNKKAKRLEIAIKIFSDDLGDALSDELGETVEIGTDREHQDAAELITQYLEKHFVVELNGKQKTISYVNHKSVREDFYATWVLLEVSKVHQIKSLRLKNDVLMEFNEGQQNYVKFRENRTDSYSRSVAVMGQEYLTLK